MAYRKIGTHNDCGGDIASYGIDRDQKICMKCSKKVKLMEWRLVPKTKALKA